MTEEGTITIVPSVHYSAIHRQRVRETIREQRPDLVAVELDERRFERLDRRSRSDPFQGLPPATAATYALLRTIQQTVVRLYGLDPGQTDMETAIETAAELETDIALIDDPIERTLEGMAAAIGPETLPRMLLRAGTMTPRERLDGFTLMATPFEKIEHGDDVQPAIDHLRRLLPEVANVLIDRRDCSMAKRLHRLRRDGYDVVAVVGAGHHNGIRRALEDLEEREGGPTVEVPLRSPRRSVTRIPID